ncbi:hypothetical protein D0T98_24545 [Burkholderia pseudomallei]|nr:hypothetical protein D0T98_24545 [Burkholderia pseudomallei]
MRAPACQCAFAHRRTHPPQPRQLHARCAVRHATDDERRATRAPRAARGHTAQHEQPSAPQKLFRSATGNELPHALA